METSCLPDFRPSKMLSTSSVIQKLGVTQKTTWGSSLWPSRMTVFIVYLFNLTGTMCMTKSIEEIRCVCFSNCEVLTTLTPDTGRILSKLHAVQPIGVISFCTGIRVAHVSGSDHHNLNVFIFRIYFINIYFCINIYFYFFRKVHNFSHDFLLQKLS